MSATLVADLLDIAGLLCLLAGALLCLAAGLGLVRFPDLLTRMHAGTKPQVLGVLAILLGILLLNRTWDIVGMVLLVGAFQLLTIPVAAHMVGRAGFRTGQIAPTDIHLGRGADAAEETDADAHHPDSGH